MRKLANVDELLMLMYLAESHGMVAATRKARQLGFPIAQVQEEDE